ncbi:hypothetical protein G7046_g4006 [Stylonectria norvegica]|nr:hypothetical protein G7046_g4006 [Stylonectria norvegica]
MCRHHLDKTFCGVTADWYRERLKSRQRFRLFMCEATKKDIQRMIAGPQPTPKDKGMARRCGLHFGGDVLGRILLGKFKTQVEFQHKCLRKSHEQASTRLPSEVPALESTSNTPMLSGNIASGQAIRENPSPSFGNNYHSQTAFASAPIVAQNTHRYQDVGLDPESLASSHSRVGGFTFSASDVVILSNVSLSWLCLALCTIATCLLVQTTRIDISPPRTMLLRLLSSRNETVGYGHGNLLLFPLSMAGRSNPRSEDAEGRTPQASTGGWTATVSRPPIPSQWRIFKSFIMPSRPGGLLSTSTTNPQQHEIYESIILASLRLFSSKFWFSLLPSRKCGHYLFI